MCFVQSQEGTVYIGAWLDFEHAAGIQPVSIPLSFRLTIGAAMLWQALLVLGPP
jgi:hypothetical protein